MLDSKFSSNQISECFMYIKSGKELWDELMERFGQPNGPFIYQLHRDLTLLMQDNGHVAAYFSQMKGCLDELLDGML